MHAGQRGEHWQRKQIKAVAGLRVRLHGNTISSALTLPPSLCLSGPPPLPSSSSIALSFSFHPSVPLGNSLLIKKMGLTPSKPFCLSVWPQQRNKSPRSHEHSHWDTADSCRQTHMQYQSFLMQHPISLHVWMDAEWKQQINKGCCHQPSWWEHNFISIWLHVTFLNLTPNLIHSWMRT